MRKYRTPALIGLLAVIIVSVLAALSGLAAADDPPGDLGSPEILPLLGVTPEDMTDEEWKAWVEDQLARLNAAVFGTTTTTLPPTTTLLPTTTTRPPTTTTYLPTTTIPPITTTTVKPTTTIAPTTTTVRPTTTTIAPTTTTTPPANFNLASAISACPSGGTVNIPPGTFTIATTIAPKSNITIRGAGLDQTFLKVTATYGFNLDGKTNITFENFAVVGTGKLGSTHSAFTVNYGASASYLTFRGLEISQMGRCGIWGGTNSRMDYVTITDCIIHDNGEFGVTHGDGGSAANWTVRRCVFYSFGPRSYPPHGFYGRNFSNLLVEDCRASGPLGAVPNGWSGFEVDDSTATFRNCVATDCKTGTDTRGGFGFIAVGASVVTYDTCSGSGNLADFYELALTKGRPTYINCVGTIRR